MQKIQSYLVWFIVTLFVVYAFCLNTATAVFTDAIKASLHVDNVGVSIATGAFILGFACMQIPAGFWLDRFSAKRVIAIGIFLLAIGNLALSYSHHIALFTLSNFLQGLGASFAFIAAAVLISQWFSPQKFPILFGLTQTLACIFAGVIHYCFTVALATHTWNDIYRGLALFGFCLLVVSLWLINSPPNYQRNKPLSLKASLAQVLANRQIIYCTLAAAASFGVLLAYAGLWYLSIQSFYALTNLQAAVIGGMIFLGIGVGTPLLGWWSNYLKSRVMVIHITLCLGTMALILGIYLPHFDTSTLIIVHIISFLIGFFLSGSMLFYTMVSEISTNATRGVALSVLNTGIFLFNTLMLFVPYLFFTAQPTPFYTYLWILPFSIMFSILILYFIKDTFNDGQ